MADSEPDIQAFPQQSETRFTVVPFQEIQLAIARVYVSRSIFFAGMSPTVQLRNQS